MRIQEKRQTAVLTQRQLAGEAGIGVATSDLERDRMSYPHKIGKLWLSGQIA